MNDLISALLSHAGFKESLPDNLELWSAPANNSEDEFVAKYTVDGKTFWDNNAGANYKFPKAFDDFAVLSGINFKVVLGTASIAAGTLHITAGVQNLEFAKIVGAVFTTDNWSTVQTAFGNSDHAMTSGVEVWVIDASVDRRRWSHSRSFTASWDKSFGTTTSPATTQSRRARRSVTSRSGVRKMCGVEISKQLAMRHECI